MANYLMPGTGLLIGITCSFVVGCSTAPYRSAVATYGTTSHAAASAALDEMNGILSAARADAGVAGALDIQSVGAPVTLPDACSAQQIPAAARAANGDTRSDAELAAACVLHVRGKPGVTIIQPFAAELDNAEIARARQIVRALADYSDGLRAISAAEDYAKLRSAVSGMGGALTRVAALAGPNGAVAGTLVGPIFRIGGEIAIIGLEARRARLMREIVPNADADIQILVTELDKAVVRLRRVRLKAAHSVLSSSVTAWNNGPKTEKSANRMLAAQLTYREAAQRIGAPGPFAKMGNAHATLASMIEEGNQEADVKAFFDSIGQLADAAEELAKAIKSVRE